MHESELTNFEGQKPGREILDILGGGRAEQRLTLVYYLSHQFLLGYILKEDRLHQPRHSPAIVSAHTPHSDAHDGLGV